MRLLLICALLFVFSSLKAQDWRVYYDSSKTYWNSDWEKSIRLLETSLTKFDTTFENSSENYAVILNDLGTSHIGTGNFQVADSLLRASLALKERLAGKNVDYAVTLVNLADLKRHSGEFEMAEGLYFDAIDIIDSEVGDRNVELANAYSQLAELYSSNDQLDRAESYYDQAIIVTRNLLGATHVDYAQLLSKVGQLLVKQGKYGSARAHYLEAMGVYKKRVGENHPGYINTLNNLGLLNLTLGEYGKAEELLVKVKDFNRLYYGANSSEYVSALNNLGSLYRKIGLYDLARQYYQESFDKYTEFTGSQVQLATIYSNMGGFYLQINDYDQAESLYLNAKEIFKNELGERHNLYSSTLQNLGALYRRKGDYEKAIEYYKSSLEIDKDILGVKSNAYITTLGNLAILNLSQKKFSLAEILLLETIELQKSALGPYHPSLAKTLNNLAIAYYAQGKVSKSKPVFEEAIQNHFYQIKTLFPSLSEKEKEAYYKTLKSDLERYNTFVVENPDVNPNGAGQLYNNQLNTKALLFNNNNRIRKNILGSGDAELIDQYREFKRKRERLGYYYDLGTVELANKGIDLKNFEAELNELEKKLSRRSEGFASSIKSEAYKWEHIRDTLQTGEAVVEMIRFNRFKLNEVSNSELKIGFSDRIYYAALIITSETKGSPKIVALDNGVEMEGRYYNYYKNAIRFQVKDQHSFSKYFEPIGKELRGIKKIYFSPDGIYHKLNLNTIRYPDGRYLLDVTNVHYITSSRDLLEQHPVNNDNTISIIANPHYGPVVDSKSWAALPGTQKEAISIEETANVNGWYPEKYLNDNASEELLKTLQSPKVLHLATHGYFSESDLGANHQLHGRLMGSGLLLAGANLVDSTRINNLMDDGTLTALEAMNLSLEKTDLVVLSACETGLGVIQNGEGVYGLQRAFMVAGAKSILISLWKVDDEATQLLISSFYRNWLAGQKMDIAFVNAQNQLRSIYPDPFHWGSFILVGDIAEGKTIQAKVE